MDIIIVCHTEYGFVHNKEMIFDKNATDGVKKGVFNLIKIVDKYSAKATFAVMPEVVKDFPRDINHEIGLHIHPGWIKSGIHQGFQWFVGDSYLMKRCNLSENSSVLRDYSYKDQLELIKTGKDCIEDSFGIVPKSFVAGRWSINNDTIEALIKSGITHECSAQAHIKLSHFDWSKLPRICMPYHPNKSDYQQKGNLPILIVPISQMFTNRSVNPEAIPSVGLSWLKACFLEYYKQGLPLFHMCLHSPCMTDHYFISAMEEFLNFISRYQNVNFKFASEIKEYNEVTPKTKILPYLLSLNRHVIGAFSNKTNVKISGGT
jgi:hypothetical protein